MKIKLQSIARQKTEDAEMEEVFAGDLTEADGLLGDFSPLCGEGEVTVLSRESWIKGCHETEIDMSWLAHGANLLIKGFEFLPTDLGRTLRIGEVELEITRETGPSELLANQAPSLHAVLGMGWRGGVVCRVIRSGSIQSGDDVDIAG